MRLSTNPSEFYWQKARDAAAKRGLADLEYVGPWSMFTLCAYEFKGRQADGAWSHFDILARFGRSSVFGDE